MTSLPTDQQKNALNRARQAWEDNQTALEKAQRAFGVPFPRQAELIQAVTDLATLRNELLAEKKDVPEATVKPSVLPDYDLVRPLAKGGDRQSGYLAAAYGWPEVDRPEEAKFSRRAGGEPTPAQLQKEYDETRARYAETPQWLKAPNGKPSNLNERQCVQVRTPRFKAWFGDFEADRNQALTPVNMAQDYLNGQVTKAREWAVENLVKQDGWPNTATGDRFIVSKRVVLHKATSGSALEKSDNAHVHLAALHDLPELIRSSVPVAAEPDHENDLNILGVHKFVAALQYADDLFAVKLTVKDHADLPRGQHRKFYVHEIVDMEVVPVAAKYAGHLRARPIVQSTGTGGAPPPPREISVGELIDAINAKEPGAIQAVSQVLDANGEPLVVYHGTLHSFDAFKHEGRRGKPRLHYFSDDATVASEYAGDIRNGTPNVMPAHVSLQNPFTFNATGEQWGSLPMSIFPPEIAVHFDERNILRTCQKTTCTT